MVDEARQGVAATGLQELLCLPAQPQAGPLEDRAEEQGEDGRREAGDKEHIPPRVVRRGHDEPGVALEGDDELDDAIHRDRDRLDQNGATIRGCRDPGRRLAGHGCHPALGIDRRVPRIGGIACQDGAVDERDRGVAIAVCVGEARELPIELRTSGRCSDRSPSTSAVVRVVATNSRIAAWSPATVVRIAVVRTCSEPRIASAAQLTPTSVMVAT